LCLSNIAFSELLFFKAFTAEFTEPKLGQNLKAKIY